MNEIKFCCPYCDQHMQAAKVDAGRQLQCPTCCHLIHIPAIPGNTAQSSPQSGMTWDTFLPSLHKIVREHKLK
jgi:hypothetical protein